MPYCTFDRVTKQFIAGQLTCPPDGYDPEKHVLLVLDSYPERSDMLNDDLITIRSANNNELNNYIEKTVNQDFSVMENIKIYKVIVALGEIVVEVSKGKKFKDIEELISELKKKYKWP